MRARTGWGIFTKIRANAHPGIPSKQRRGVNDRILHQPPELRPIRTTPQRKSRGIRRQRAHPAAAISWTWQKRDSARRKQAQKAASPATAARQRPERALSPWLAGRHGRPAPTPPTTARRPTPTADNGDTPGTSDRFPAEEAPENDAGCALGLQSCNLLAELASRISSPAHSAWRTPLKAENTCLTACSAENNCPNNARQRSA